MNVHILSIDYIDTLVSVPSFLHVDIFFFPYHDLVMCNKIFEL